MVKDSSKKLKVKEAEKVDEVIVKKVEEPKKDITSETTIKEEPKKEITKMPKEIEKPKPTKRKAKKLVKTGNESLSDAVTNEGEKIATGNSLGIYAGVTIAVILAVGLGYYAYTKLFKKKKVKEIDVKDIKSISEVKKVET
jgi:hypothetical protein